MTSQAVFNHLAVGGGGLSTMGSVQYLGGYHEYRGGYLSTVGGVQYREGYHEYCGGYLEYRGGYLVSWGYYDACEGYHEYHGGPGVFSTVEDIIFCNLSTVGDTTIHVGEYHEYRGGAQYYGRTQMTEDCITMILIIPRHGTHDIPHVHHDIPKRY